MSNLELWDKLGKTDPAHTKGFKRAGGFGGTAIKPIYTTKKMTEEFGPAGQGWGMGEPSFQIVNGSEGQIAVYCTVALWYNHPKTQSGPHTVYGVGGDMVVVKQSSGLRTDDEAFKKAFTDAVGNAMKHLGMSADVHMGLFDDSKYVQEMREEAKAASKPKQDPAVDHQATFTRLSQANAKLSTLDEFNKFWKQGNVTAAFDSLPDQLHSKMQAEHADKAAELMERAAMQDDDTPAGFVPPSFDNLEK